MQQTKHTPKPETDREREMRLMRDAQIVTTRCGFCDETDEGALSEGRIWYAKHLRSDHPEVKPKPASAGKSRKRR